VIGKLKEELRSPTYILVNMSNRRIINFNQKGFTKNFLQLMKTKEQQNECCIDFLEQVYTESNVSILFSGTGTQEDPLTAIIPGVLPPSANNGISIFGVNTYQLGGDLIQNTSITVPNLITFAVSADGGGGIFSFFPLPNGSTNITLATGDDGSSNSSTLNVTSTGIFLTLSGLSSTTLIYLENNYIEIDCAEMVIASPLTIVDGSQGNAGDIWTSVDTGGDGHWQPYQAASAPPASPVTGNIYQDGTHAYMYLSGSWKQLDN
jgi:hypothetical protein